jgi:uncharacterized protein YndB with AHSA1/START domain
MINNNEGKESTAGSKYQPVAKAEMLIHRPVAEVFEAFVNPVITSKFWFSQGSGRLEAASRLNGIGRCMTSPFRWM